MERAESGLKQRAENMYVLYFLYRIATCPSSTWTRSQTVLQMRMGKVKEFDILINSTESAGGPPCVLRLRM